MNRGLFFPLSACPGSSLFSCNKDFACLLPVCSQSSFFGSMNKNSDSGNNFLVSEPPPNCGSPNLRQPQTGHRKKDQNYMRFLATGVDLEIIMLSEVSHTVRHQHQMLSLTCGIWRKDRMNFLQNRCWDIEILMVSGGDGLGGWWDVLGLWDGNPVKLDCYDHYTTTDVINSFE